MFYGTSNQITTRSNRGENVTEWLHSHFDMRRAFSIDHQEYAEDVWAGRSGLMLPLNRISSITANTTLIPTD